MAQIHRFHETVAIYLNTGNTVYLSPKDARKLAGLLYKAAKDIKEKPFDESEFKSTNFGIEV